MIDSGKPVGERVAALEADNTTRKDDVKELWSAVSGLRKEVGALKAFQTRILTLLGVAGALATLAVTWLKSLIPHST